MVVAQDEFYVKYCKFFHISGLFKKLGQKILSKKLSGIADYLNRRYALLPKEIMAACAGTFLLTFIPLMILLLQVHLVIGFIIPVFVSYLTAYSVFNYPIAKYNQIQRILLQYSDLAFQDLTLILNTTNSIFDAVQFLSKARYPVLSEKFSDILFEITFNRKSPEFLINQFIYELPSGELKERLLTIMATNFQPDKLLNQMEILAGEKRLEYSIATEQLENKLLILMAICLFLPMVFGLFLSFLGTTGNYLSLIIFPLFIVSIHKLKDRTMKNQFELFGENSALETGELGSGDSEMIEFLNFLTHFGNELKRKLPPEIALLKAYTAYQGVLSRLIKQCCIEVFCGGGSFEEGWSLLKEGLNNSQVNFLMNLITRMVEKSSSEAGERIISTLQQMKVNRELIRERESIIKAQQFKIKFLIFIMAGVIGLIAGLTPMLIQMGSLISLPESAVEVHFFDSFPITLSLCLMVIYSGLFLAKLVKIQRPARFSLWAFLIFIILCFISSSLLG